MPKQELNSWQTKKALDYVRPRLSKLRNWSLVHHVICEMQKGQKPNTIARIWIQLRYIQTGAQYSKRQTFSITLNNIVSVKSTVLISTPKRIWFWRTPPWKCPAIIMATANPLKQMTEIRWFQSFCFLMQQKWTQAQLKNSEALVHITI